MAEKKVAVIGAGVSGLAAVKIALEYGLQPTCFEQRDDIGGIWDAVHPFPDHLQCVDGRVYKGLTLNTSKPYYAYSDFPSVREHPYYMHAGHVKEYLCAYADKFNLKSHIQCGRQVKRLEKAQDYETTGKWTVTTVDAKTKANESVETFDAVYVCTGYFGQAKIPPPYPGQEKFSGAIIHARKFWDAEPYKDQRILVVGGGISACDISSSLAAGGAKKVYIVAREGMWVMPRTLKNGRSYLDLFLNRGFRTHHASLKDFEDDMYKLCSARFDFSALGLTPSKPICHVRHGISDDIDKWIYSGFVKCIKGVVESFTEDGVKLSNGEEIKVDHVILATGYRYCFPFINDKQLIPDENPETKWWMYMYPVEQKHSTFFLIGMFYLIGSLPAFAELQARAACGIVQGELSLPHKDQMQKWIKDDTDFQTKLYGGHLSGVVDGYTYMVDLAQFVGCWPSMDHLEEISSDLATDAWNGPLYPAHLRLMGRHAKQKLAIESLMKVEENAFAAHRNLNEKNWKRPLV